MPINTSNLLRTQAMSQMKAHWIAKRYLQNMIQVQADLAPLPFELINDGTNSIMAKNRHHLMEWQICLTQIEQKEWDAWIQHITHGEYINKVSVLYRLVSSGAQQTILIDNMKTVLKILGHQDEPYYFSMPEALQWYVQMAYQSERMLSELIKD